MMEYDFAQDTLFSGYDMTLHYKKRIEAGWELINKDIYHEAYDGTYPGSRYDTYTYRRKKNNTSSYTKEDMKKAFSNYAHSSISQQPYNDKELNEHFDKFLKSLNK